MNLKQIEAVVQIARMGSLSKAATSLGLAQSLLSRNLTALESAWGRQLFDRHGRGLELSEFGRLMLPECEAILKQQDKMVQLVAQTSGKVTGTVHLGVAPSVAHSVIPGFVWELKNLLPDVVVSIHEGVSGRLDDWLTSGRIDLAIVNRHCNQLPDTEDLLAEVDMHLVSANTRQRTSDAAPFDSLDGVPLILPANPCEFRTSLRQIAKDRNIVLNIVFEAESVALIKELVAAGRASTILPLDAVKLEVESGALSASKLVSPTFRRKISLCSSRQHQLSPAARHVMRHVMDKMPNLLRLR